MIRRESAAAHRLCGPECRYRALYEGSQSSLADMASAQASALGRVGRLRSGTIASLKRVFPRQFAAAEQALGKRLSEVDDEVLLAYLEGFCTLAAASGGLEGAALLRELCTDIAPGELGPAEGEAAQLRLIAARIQQSHDHLRGQLRSAERQVQVLEAELAVLRQRTSTLGAGPVIALPGLFDDLLAPAPSTAPVPASTQEVSLPTGEGAGGGSRRGKKRRRGGEGSTSPGAQGTPPPEIPLPPVPPAQPGPARTQNAPVESGELAPEEPPLPEEPGLDWAPPPWEEPEFEPPPSSQLAPSPALEEDQTRSEDRDEPESPAEGSEGARGAVAPPLAAPAPAAPVRSSPAPAKAPASEEGSGDIGAPEQRSASEIPSVPPPRRRSLATATARERASESGENLTAHTTPPSAASSTDASAPPAAVPAAVPAAAREEPAPTARKTTTGLRPELLFPAASGGGRTRRRTPAKAIRTSATSPDPLVFDVPVEQSERVDVGEDTAKALLAAVCIPRPVFTSDLAALPQSGGAEGVLAWEQNCHDDPHSPVRFVNPKVRHKLRGALVLPHGYLRDAAVEFTRSWWAECLTKHRSTALYELAVLLHRVGEDVVGHQITDEVGVFRLNQPRGLVGLVAALKGSLAPGEPLREQLVTAVEQLISERLTLIAVVAVNAAMIEPLVTALTEEAQARGWKPAMAVIVALSWEFADDNGSSATLVLGG